MLFHCLLMLVCLSPPDRVDGRARPLQGDLRGRQQGADTFCSTVHPRCLTPRPLKAPHPASPPTCLTKPLADLVVNLKLVDPSTEGTEGWQQGLDMLVFSGSAANMPQVSLAWEAARRPPCRGYLLLLAATSGLGTWMGQHASLGEAAVVGRAVSSIQQGHTANKLRQPSLLSPLSVCCGQRSLPSLCVCWSTLPHLCVFWSTLQPANEGDIILVHRAGVQFYQNKAQLLGKLAQGKPFAYALFDGECVSRLLCE